MSTPESYLPQHAYTYVMLYVLAHGVTPTPDAVLAWRLRNFDERMAAFKNQRTAK